MSFRVASVSIARYPVKPDPENFDRFWKGVGQNTGNLMFTESVFHLLDAEVQQIGFSFSPDDVNAKFDAVVIPAANWLNANAQWDLLSELIEKLTIPVILIGIGLQAGARTLESVKVSESAIRLVRLVSERSPSVSVRGDFTKAWLNSIGVQNVTTTGCPSLYMNAFKNEREPDPHRFALQGTRYFASKAFNQTRPVEHHLFRSVAAVGAPMIFQSESEEMQRLLVGKSLETFPEEASSALVDLYGLKSVDELDGFIDRFGKVFYNLSDWSNFVAALYGVVGTRLHGSIIALNSGRRALLFGHDSRTQEVAEFASIPSITAEHLKSLRTANDYLNALSDAKVQDYYDARADNQIRFQQFLREAGLPYRPECMF